MYMNSQDHTELEGSRSRSPGALDLERPGPVLDGDTPSLFEQTWDLSDTLATLPLEEVVAVARATAA